MRYVNVPSLTEIYTPIKPGNRDMYTTEWNQKIKIHTIPRNIFIDCNNNATI